MVPLAKCLFKFDLIRLSILSLSKGKAHIIVSPSVFGNYFHAILFFQLQLKFLGLHTMKTRLIALKFGFFPMNIHPIHFISLASSIISILCFLFLPMSVFYYIDIVFLIEKGLFDIYSKCLLHPGRLGAYLNQKV